MSNEYIFDIEIPYSCEFEVAVLYGPDRVDNCGKPAAYLARWVHEEYTQEMHLCEEHFRFVKSCEEATNETRGLQR